MTNTAAKTQVQRFYESEYGNFDTLAGTGKAITAGIVTAISFPFAGISLAAATKDATIDIAASVDGINYDVAILSGHTVTAGTRHTELITNVGYRLIKVTATQALTGTTDLFYVLK